jgi:hypothetical protein
MDRITALLYRNQTLLDEAAKARAVTTQIVMLLAETLSCSVSLAVEAAFLIDQCHWRWRVAVERSS